MAPEGVDRVGAHLEAAPQLAKQRFLSHDPQNPLMVDGPAAPIELSGDPTVSVARKLQNDSLHGVAQFDICCVGFLLWSWTLVIP